MQFPLAIILLVVGILLLLFGLSATDSIQNAFSQLFTGHLTDNTMWLIVGGSVCLVAGIYGCYRTTRQV